MISASPMSRYQPDKRQKAPSITACLGIYLLASTPLSADIYLSKAGQSAGPGKKAVTEFNCRDRIYGVVTGQWPPQSRHLLEAFWVDPRGKQREHTKYPFIARKGTTRTWVWLQLYPAEPDIVDRLLMQGNEYAREFHGEWEVTFFIDKVKKTKLKFNVSCH